MKLVHKLTALPPIYVRYVVIWKTCQLTGLSQSAILPVTSARCANITMLASGPLVERLVDFCQN
jgi:hypothetical protein